MNKNIQHKDVNSGKLLKYCIIPQPATSSDAMLSFEKNDNIILAVMNEEYVLKLSQEDVWKLIRALFEMSDNVTENPCSTYATNELNEYRALKCDECDLIKIPLCSKCIRA